jgi:formylglycine-generating enzyme required for sulfatase activity
MKAKGYSFLTRKHALCIKRFALFMMLFVVAISATANNIQVTNVSLKNKNVTDDYVQAEFDISWENSWRTSSGVNNWDAAWVFIKYKAGTGDWQHASLNTTASNHAAPSGSTISVPADGRGVFIYRDADGNGTFTATDVRLRWEYGTDGVADNAQVQIKVFAIEMVYVPQGSFYVGTGGTERGSFTQANAVSPNNSVPFQITATSPTLQGNNALSLSTNLGARAGSNQSFDLGTTTNTANLAAGYPTGYAAFYCMKYEITQGQYRDFLNNLTRGQQENCIINDGQVGTYPGGNYWTLSPNPVLAPQSPGDRIGVRIVADPGSPEPRVYGCDLNKSNSLPSGVNQVDDGEWLAMGTLSWANLCSYFDWSGLRPMTELEFEKACRGDQAPVVNEFAWGDASAVVATSIINGGTSSESFSPSNANLNLSNELGVQGMMRAGVFATGSSTRAQSGSSYYGIMQLSGNAIERCVTVGNVAGRSYTGLHGNGSITNNGNADVDYWPGINGNDDPTIANTTFQGTTGVTFAAGGGFRGGVWTFEFDLPQVSDRGLADNKYAGSNAYYGGRGVRSAP